MLIVEVMESVCQLWVVTFNIAGVLFVALF